MTETHEPAAPIAPLLSPDAIRTALPQQPVATGPVTSDALVNESLMADRARLIPFDGPEGLATRPKSTRSAVARMNSRTLDLAALTPAAVLVPLIERPGGLSVLLTERADHLNRHAGQIAFPGGRADPGDPDPTATALRETLEETGIAPDYVDVLGFSRDYATFTGYRITPVVGFLQPGFDLRPDPAEVADVFEVPFDHVMNPAHHKRVHREFHGIDRAYYAIEYGNRYIWGATAGMLVNLHRVLSSR